MFIARSLGAINGRREGPRLAVLVGNDPLKNETKPCKKNSPTKNMRALLRWMCRMQAKLVFKAIRLVLFLLVVVIEMLKTIEIVAFQLRKRFRTVDVMIGAGRLIRTTMERSIRILRIADGFQMAHRSLIEKRIVRRGIRMSQGSARSTIGVNRRDFDHRMTSTRQRHRRMLNKSTI